MDKNTLSQYGWVVICIIVIAILLGLATPFSNFVKDSVYNTTTSFGDKVVASLDGAGVDIESNNSGGSGGSGPVAPDTSNITTEVSDNTMMAFVDMNTGDMSEKMFGAWASDTTRIEFTKNYDAGLNIVDDPAVVTADSGNALDISEAGDGSVVAYRTVEGEDKVLNISGKDGVVMANEMSAFVFASLPYAKTVEFNNAYNTENAVYMAMMFYNDLDDGYGITSWESLDLSSFNTSNVTNMYQMFGFCAYLTELDMSSFDTSNVTDMGYMFFFCTSLTSLDVSNFDTSNVLDMSGMFNGMGLKTLDVSSFDTSNVTHMNQMFHECYSLETLDLSNFDTSNVTDMSSMFGYCEALKSVNLTSFNTLKVERTDYMFRNCKSLKILDLSSFNTANITDMEGMFWCSVRDSALEHIYVGNGWDTSNADVRGMFTGCGVDAVEKK